MRPFIILLSTIVGILSILFLFSIISPMDGLTGLSHPKFSNMKIGPETIGMHSHTRALSYALAAVLIGMFVTILYIGSRRNESGTKMNKWIYAFGIIYLGIFTAMITTNWSYVSSSENDFWGQMPVPTAWMIYAVWLSPLILVVAYVIGFEKWVISPEEENELLTWLKENQS